MINKINFKKMPFRNILVIIPESEDWKDAWRNLANQVQKKSFFFTNLWNMIMKNAYLSLTIQVQAVTVQIYGKQLRLLETF